jgi:SAM-dependent methyltransferase
MGGGYQMLMGVMPVVGLLIDAFRTGERIPQSAYPEDWWQGMERSSLGWIEDCLVQEWIPAMPAVEKALVVGADVADVGCGRGQCLIKLAVAYPNSRFVGYDHFAPGIERANQLAAEYGVADRLHFEFRDASAGIPGQFDVITTFDVIHDGVDPSQLLREIRGALRPGGTFVCLDANCSERLAQNHAPSGVFLHGLSVLYCLNTSLAEGGAGLGTLGVHERSMLRELCTASGFSNVRHVPINNPLKILYEVSTPVSEFTASPTATHAVSYDPRISGHPTRSITGRDEDTW